MSGAHAERILQLLAGRPGLDDDEIARALAIEPRQTVNQVCRRLAARGELARERGSGGKIVNRAIAAGAAATPDPAGAGGRPIAAQKKGSRSGHTLVPADLAATLVIVPCAGEKHDHAGVGEPGPSILQSLPAALAQELSAARASVRARAGIDESTLVPAWRRYDGSLYKVGREAIADLLQAGTHIIILSGGYGAVLATEPIGTYDAALKSAWWPDNVLGRVLVAYAHRHGLSSVRAFCSATGPYRQVLQRIRWRGAGIEDVLLITPEAGPGGMRKSPASQGEALAALRDGTLSAGWQSSYGLGLEIGPSPAS